MSLYDRQYSNNRLENEYQTRESEFSQSQVSDRTTFIKQTYQLLTASLFAATAGAFIGASYVPAGMTFVLFIVEIALLIGLMFTRKNPSLALILLFAFTFTTGLVLGPTLNMYVAAGMGNIITQAFVMTAVAFGGLTLFAFNTTKDFSVWGKGLFIALIVLVVASLLNIFFKSPMAQLAISSVAAILFSFYILYDTQNIIKGRVDSPVLAAVSLYLDILNLFISLLQILGIFSNRD